MDDSLPNCDDEAGDPVDADRRYEEAIAVLRERTRERERFPLVYEENAEYGFRRNCLGLRPIAVGIAVVVLVLSGLLFVFADESLARRGARYGTTAGMAAVALFAWWRLVTSSWVRRAGEVYADRLFESISTLKLNR